MPGRRLSIRMLLALGAVALGACGACGGAERTTGGAGGPGGDTVGVDTVFREDFESGTLAQWEDGVDAAKHRVRTDGALAHGGSRYLEVTYPQGGTGGYLTRWFMPGYDSLYVRMWVRLDPAWRSGTKFLALYGSRIDNRWSAFGQASRCPTGTDFFASMLVTEPGGDPGPARFYTYYPAMRREPDGTTCWGRYGDGTEAYVAPLTISRGEWHRLELWVKLNAPSRSDAVQQFWIDGTLRGTWNGIALRSSDVLRLNSVQLSFSPSGNGAPQQQVLLVDDVLVTTARPSS